MTIRSKNMHIFNFEIEIIKKNIKNIHLGVYPPNGRIRVAAPLKITDDKIRFFVISKIAWIKKQQLIFLQQERQTRREYISGESHYFFGRRYRLNVIYTDSNPRIEIKRKNYIDFYIKSNTTIYQKEKIFMNFYRVNLMNLIPNLLKKWQKKARVDVKEVRIKKMKTRWGTCNIAKKRIWLNLELAKKPLNCIDYIFVHELIHLLEKNHTERFMHILESIMPNWQNYKNELDEEILGYTNWKYQISSI